VLDTIKTFHLQDLGHYLSSRISDDTLSLLESNRVASLVDLVDGYEAHVQGVEDIAEPDSIQLKTIWGIDDKITSTNRREGFLIGSIDRLQGDQLIIKKLVPVRCHAFCTSRVVYLSNTGLLGGPGIHWCS